MNRTSALLFALFLLTPAAGLDAKPLPPGTRILSMVVELGSREAIVAGGEGGALGMLHASGVTDEEITDGSIALGIVYCCGGKISRETLHAFYVPPEFRVAVGDVVEIALGRTPSKKERKAGDLGTVNRAVRVRESFEQEQGQCRWDPEDESLWMRVLYCDWMLGEGWEYRGGLSKGWFRPAPGPG